MVFIERWTDAFLVIFTNDIFSIHITAHPEIHDGRLGAEKSHGWARCDEQLRFRMAVNSLKEWGIVDSEL